MHDLEDRHLLYEGGLGSRYARFNEKWGPTLMPVLAVALAVAVVLVIVFASLYGAESNDNSSPGGGLVASCSAPFTQPTEAWLATMRQGLRQRLLSPAVWQTEAGGEAEGVVLVMGLGLSYRNDVELDFFQETNFLYLTGVNEPGYSAIIDVASGNTTLFMPVRDRNYAIWSGRIMTPDEVKTKYGVEQVLSADQLSAALYNVTKQSTLSVFTLPATAQQPFLANFTVNSTVLSKALAFARPVKSADEIALLRISSNVSATAHIKLMESVKAGIYEYNVEGLFVNLCYGCGLAYQAYKPIAGAGESSAILHYTANNAPLKDGQIILIDAGGAYLGYASDITRTYPVNGRWTRDQTLIYTMVGDIQAKGLSMMVPGANYSVLASGLRSYFNEVLLREGFVKGDLAALDANGISSYFCPHGFTHHVGLDVHDPGDIGILKPGYVLTMEPGLYFMEALLVPALNNNTGVADYLVKDKIQHFLDSKFGGVRIEDVVLITDKGNDIISNAVPKSIDAIERIMRP